MPKTKDAGFLLDDSSVNIPAYPPKGKIPAKPGKNSTTAKKPAPKKGAGKIK